MFRSKTAPSYFCRIIQQWAKDLPDTVAYFDDIAIASSDFKSFKNSLTKLLSHCEETNVRLNPSKSTIGPNKLRFLGRLVGPNAIEIGPERLQSLHEAELPHSRKVLQSFLDSRFGSNDFFLAMPS